MLLYIFNISLMQVHCKNIESCVLKRLDKYKIRKRKEYIECTYKQVINV